MPVRFLAAMLAVVALSSCHLPRPPPPIRGDAQAAVTMMYGFCAGGTRSDLTSRHMGGVRHPNARDTQSITDTRERLAITADQALAWSAYVEAVQADWIAMSAMHQRMMAPSAAASAPDRLQLRIDAMSARLASMQRLLAAEQALYASLSSEQRTTADAILDRNCGQMFYQGENNDKEGS